MTLPPAKSQRERSVIKRGGKRGVNEDVDMKPRKVKWRTQKGGEMQLGCGAVRCSAMRV